MTKFKNLAGKVFGDWAVIGKKPAIKGKAAFWFCRCSCGSVNLVRGDALRRGKSQRCGKCSVEIFSQTHGQTRGRKGTRTYNSWRGIKQRCCDPKRACFERYGGCGIKVCERWLDSFENFFDDMGVCPDKLSIERIDNDGDYEPGNCKWATQKEQCRNTRRNHMIEFDGQLLCLTEWSERFGYGDPAGLWYALVRGATMEEIALRRGYYG